MTAGKGTKTPARPGRQPDRGAQMRALGGLLVIAAGIVVMVACSPRAPLAQHPGSPAALLGVGLIGGGIAMIADVMRKPHPGRKER